jgi:hypothetical protein
MFCPCWMSDWSLVCYSLFSGCMWLCFVLNECFANPLSINPCSQLVCGCFLSLMNVWLILCLSFFALSEYVIVFCPCWMFAWFFVCHSLLSGCMWLCFVFDECLTYPLFVIPCSQHVCSCFWLFWLFCLTFCFKHNPHSGYDFSLHNYTNPIFQLLFPIFRRYFLFIFLVYFC